MKSGLINTLGVLKKQLDQPFTFDEVVEAVGARTNHTVLALTYLKEKGLLEQMPGGEKWRLRDDALPALEGVLSVWRRVNRRPSESVLRGFLAFRPFRLKVFLGLAREQGFARNEALRFLNMERQLGYLKEAVILLLGLQMSHIESFRFYMRVKFVGPEAFRSFKAKCVLKGLDFIEEEFLMSQYPKAIAQRAQRHMERNSRHPMMEKSGTWFFLQEFRKRVLAQPKNPAYGICH